MSQVACSCGVFFCQETRGNFADAVVAQMTYHWQCGHGLRVVGSLVAVVVGRKEVEEALVGWVAKGMPGKIPLARDGQGE